MVTVGFRELYRYGGKFFGYFLVVGGLTAAFLGGGAYLASQEMTLVDPSLSALSETRAFVGVLAMSIGALLGTVGFFGLAHKLMTESMERALASREAELAVGSATGTATVDTDERGTERETGRVPRRASEPEPEPAAVGRHPDEAPEPVDEPAAEQPTPPEPVEESATGAAGSAGAADSSEPTTVDAVDADFSPGEEPPVDEGAAESPAAENAAREWTPPDPSEFDTPSEPEPESDAGQPTGQPESDVGQSAGQQEPDAGQSAGQQEPDAGQPAGEPEPNAGPDPDEVPDDETLADQGVESFQAGSEDDPLTDRLPSSDDE